MIELNVSAEALYDADNPYSGSCYFCESHKCEGGCWQSREFFNPPTCVACQQEDCDGECLETT